MKLPIYQVDAFTNQTFEGNPAAVCPLKAWLPTEKMLAIAAENNLSETAFFVKKEEGAYDLRWFTPALEIDLCGHATLAAAFVIFEKLGHTQNRIDFHSKSGLLSVTKREEFLYLDFPSRKPETPKEVPVSLAEGTAFNGVKPISVLKSRDYLVVFESEKQILEIVPDLRLLEQIDTLGIIITSKGTNADFVSRFFAPRAGVNEDPVTGSAHCTLIPYWAEFLGKSVLTAYQLSERKGFVKCEMLGSRVKIGGEAVLYLEGTISV